LLHMYIKCLVRESFLFSLSSLKLFLRNNQRKGGFVCSFVCVVVGRLVLVGVDDDDDDDCVFPSPLRGTSVS